MLGVKRGSTYQSRLNRISQMSADFVICGKDATVLAVIELDDASHQSDRRKVADAKKDHALSAADIKLVRWEAPELPDDATIRRSLLPYPLAQPGRLSAGGCAPSARRRLAWFIRAQKIMSEHYDWKNATHTCKDCGWVGLGHDAEIGETYNDGAEYHCPKCKYCFGYISYPLLGESLTDPRSPETDRMFAEMALRGVKKDTDAP